MKTNKALAQFGKLLKNSTNTPIKLLFYDSKYIMSLNDDFVS
jgi:hypothetical protein